MRAILRLSKWFRRGPRFDVSEDGVIDLHLTFEEYVVAVHAMRAHHPEWRSGQTYFNVLHAHRPDLANWIRATQLDPFYVDAKIGAFLRYVSDNW